MSDKRYVCHNNHTIMSSRVPSYSGVLGSDWFTEAHKGKDKTAIKDEAEKRNEYVNKIRQEKANIVLVNELIFDSLGEDGIIHFTKETEKEKHHLEFYIREPEYLDLENRLGVTIFNKKETK